MNVLSLFDGISCGRIALQRAGIKIDNYYASEIDKQAIKVSQANYPDIIHIGDVKNVQVSELPFIPDLVLAGSPCQGFSKAGKQLNFEDPRSKLFFEFIRVLNDIKKINPNVLYLLENVMMNRESELIINGYMNTKPIIINSSLVSAQNRERNYWTNINAKTFGLFEEYKPEIKHPIDKNIYIRDILQPLEEIEPKYYLSEGMLNYFRKRKSNFNNGKINIRDIDGKSSTLTQSYSSCDISDNFILSNTSFEAKANQLKSGCLTPGGAKGGGLHSDMDLIITHSLQPRSGKGVGGKGHLQKKDGKSYCVDTNNSQATEMVTEIGGGNIRRFTPIECERLQTIPDNYTSMASDTQRYKQTGNGWTVDVIAHILSHI
jgi:DNA-cytosine methyltransferase